MILHNNIFFQNNTVLSIPVYLKKSKKGEGEMPLSKSVCFLLLIKIQWFGLPSEVEAEPLWPASSAPCPRQQQAASILTSPPFCPRIPSLFLWRQTHAAMSVMQSKDSVTTAVTPNTMTSGNSVRSFTVADGTRDENKPWGKNKNKTNKHIR